MSSFEHGLLLPRRSEPRVITIFNANESEANKLKRIEELYKLR